MLQGALLQTAEPKPIPSKRDRLGRPESPSIEVFQAIFLTRFPSLAAVAPLRRAFTPPCPALDVRGFLRPTFRANVPPNATVSASALSKNRRRATPRSCRASCRRLRCLVADLLIDLAEVTSGTVGPLSAAMIAGIVVLDHAGLVTPRTEPSASSPTRRRSAITASARQGVASSGT